MERKDIIPKGTCLYHSFKYPTDEIMTWSPSEIVNQLEQNAMQPSNSDWGESLYLAYNDCVSKGYIEGEGFLLKVKFTSDLPCIKSDNEVYAYGEVATPTEDIKQEVEEVLESPIGNTPFMTYLKEHHRAYECFTDRDFNKEVIMPSVFIEGSIKVLSITKYCYDKRIEGLRLINNKTF